mgnify:CR=1 FL=1
MDELEKNKNRRKIYISLLVSVLCIIGVSYAFFTLYLRQGDNNAVTALSCFTTTLTEENSALNLTNEFPISDENGMKKTPFTFKLTNTCDKYVKAYITLDPLKEGEDNYILSKYIKANLSSKGTTNSGSLIVGNQSTKELENKDNGYILKEVVLSPKESKEYDLRIWIDYDTTKEQAAGMSYPSQIVIVTEPSKTSLAGAILADNEVVEPLTVPGKEVSAHTLDNVEEIRTASVSSTYQAYYVTYGTGWEANGSNFNLTGTAVTSGTYANSYSSLVGKYLTSSSLVNTGSSTSGTKKTTTNLSSVYYVVSATSSSFTYKILGSNKNTTEALFASAEDDYGTSYYFRGAVRNNYVEFANKCWRIVRITGNGSVKLILHNDNANKVSNPCSSANNNATAALTKFKENSFNESSNDNAYIGFMYGTAGSNNYANTHANINKSTVLTNLETWYTNNLASYESKLADTIWCNDKSTGSSDLGYGTNKTYYGAYNRLASTKQPTLKCPDDNNGGKLSKFTVSDTINGNGNLTYKIGLLTADEVAFAGNARYLTNNGTYLSENAEESWWTMSPNEFTSNATIWLNTLNYSYNVVYGNNIRPAIALIPSATISGGSGTSEDPYIVD